MAETNNVFISWSGPRSKRAAEALKDWLPLVVPTANPWMSATNIDKGTRWREEVAAALDTMKAGIICLTPENLTADWLLFEAGALSKTHDPKTRVWTYLLGDLKPQHVKDPLAIFQATTTEKEDTRKLVHSINKNLDGTAPENRVNYLFDKLWPDLEEELAAIPAPSGAAPPKRPPEEMLAESLELLRSVAPLIQEVAAETDVVRRERLTVEKFRNAFGNAQSKLADPNAFRYFVDILKPSTIITTPPERDHPPMEAPAEPTPSSNQPQGAPPLPSSPGRKTHAPRARKHVSPSPKAKHE